MRMHRVAIADDEPAIRRGLSLIPWETLGFSLAGTFPDGRELIAFLSMERVDAVLCDIRMSHVSGIEVAEWIHVNQPQVQMVLLSGYADFEYAKSAILYRVVNYLLKPTDPSELMDTFAQIKKHLVEQDREERLREEESGEQEDWLLRQIETHLNAQGYANVSQASIAAYLGISPSHLSRLFRQQTGETVMSFITRCRVDQAKQLLRQSPAKVKDIGHTVGYNDIRHFVRVFTAQVGMTPSEYRRKRGE